MRQKSLGDDAELDTTIDELGADYFDKRSEADLRQRYFVQELEKLGNTVSFEPAA